MRLVTIRKGVKAVYLYRISKTESMVQMMDGARRPIHHKDMETKIEEESGQDEIPAV